MPLSASFAPIVADPAVSRAFYQDALGLSFEGQSGDYRFTDALGGVKHFGLWPLREAAQAYFGTPDGPARVPVPQASVEFELADVDAVATAAAEFQAGGHQLLHEGADGALGPDHYPAAEPRGVAGRRVLHALVRTRAPSSPLSRRHHR